VTNKLALVVAVVLGVLSILGIKAYVERIQESNLLRQEMMEVMVAARDIDENRLFMEDDIETARFPRATLEQALRNTWVTDKQTVLGVRTKAKIKAGQILLVSHFHSGGPVSGQGPKFGKDQRAITIPISRTGGLAGMLKPQDTVDLIASLSIKDPAGKQVQVTRTLLKSVQIIATDNVTSAYAASGGFYSTLTFALSPRDTNKLLFAINQGAQLQCALLQPGTPPSQGFLPVTADDLYQEIIGELRRRR
jgi:Flp pilus assembly protein CpaB